MFPSFASGRQRRAFWHSNQQKHSKRVERKKGRLADRQAGDMPSGGGGVLKGKARGRSSIIGQTGGRGERCPSSNLKKSRRRRTRTRRRKVGRERGRALSCRPGSQIRRGLKSGVDCV